MLFIIDYRLKIVYTLFMERKHDQIEHQNSEKLSIEEVNNIIAASGNHEAKALLLMTMADGGTYTSSGIKQKFTDLQGDQPGWDISHKTLIDYLERSFVPHRLVEKIPLPEDQASYKYRITHYAQEKAIPLIGSLMEYGEEYTSISLINTFGHATSPSKPHPVETDAGEILYRKRTPATRLKIFWELLTHDLPIREIDLACNIGEIPQGGAIPRHLTYLKKAGIVLYESAPTEGSYTFYRVLPQDMRPQRPPPFYNRQKTLTETVYHILLTHANEFVSVQTIFEQILTLWQQQQKLVKEESFRKNVISTLSHLRSLGYITVEKFDQNTRSEISLTPEQRIFLEGLVSIVDAHQNRDPRIIERGKQYGEELVKNTSRVAHLMEKARLHSIHAHATSHQITTQRILTLIEEHPTVNARELSRLLEETYGQELQYITVRNYLARLARSGLIRLNDEEGRTKRWIIGEATKTTGQ